MKIFGNPLPGMPWEERPEGCKDVLWRYSANPVIPRDLLPDSNSIFNSAINRFKTNATIVSVENSMVRVGYVADLSEAEGLIEDALNTWKGDNIDTAALYDSPLVQHLINGSEFDNSALYDMIINMSPDAAVYVDQYLDDAIHSSLASDLADGVMADLRANTDILVLKDEMDNQGIDLGLDAYPDVLHYVLGVSVDYMNGLVSAPNANVAAGYEDAMKAAVDALINDNISSVSGYDDYVKLAKLASINSLANAKVSNIATALRSETAQDLIGNRGNSYVQRAIKWIDRIPASAKVEFRGVSFTRAELKSYFNSGMSNAEVMEAVAQFITDKGLGNLCLNDFADGEAITVSYGDNSFGFYLWIEIE